MSEHGNSNQNKNQHHLYEIWDKVEQETFKYGISDDPIEEDGLSARARQQMEWYNVIVGYFRFIARILRLDIGDRENAKHIEDDYMDVFEAEHGRRPRGNRKRNFKKKAG